MRRQHQLPLPFVNQLDLQLQLACPGWYSCCLAPRGYEVHLVDPVPKHLEQARKASASQPKFPLASVTEGDVRSLHYLDASADILLLMGPLYHLPDRAHRLRALLETRRILKPGGILIATAIKRFASLIGRLVSGHIDDPAFISMLKRDLIDGRHLPEMNVVKKYFTIAFFHRPEELEVEVTEAGFGQM